MEFLQQIHRYVAFSIYYGRRKNAFSCRLRNSRDKTTLEIGGLGPTNGNRDGNKRTYDHLQFAITFCLCAILHTLRMNVSFVVFFLCVICSHGTQRRQRPNTKCVFYFNDRIIFTYTINRLISSMTQPFSSYCVFASPLLLRHVLWFYIHLFGIHPKILGRPTQTRAQRVKQRLVRSSHFS